MELNPIPKHFKINEFNSFDVMIEPNIPGGARLDPPNIIRIDSGLSQTEQSIILVRFALFISYQLGRTGALKDLELTDSHMDFFTVNVWQWLAFSGLLNICTPEMCQEWVAAQLAKKG